MARQVEHSAVGEELGQAGIAWPDFYFLRHGLTDANLKRFMCGGQWDIGLHPAGISQAFTVAQGALRKCGELKTVCCSPMKRARQTTAIINTTLKLPVIVVEELREIMVGEWERKPWQGLPDPFLEPKNPPGGEKIVEFQARVLKAVGISLTNPGPVLIVAHGGVWYALARGLGLKQGLMDNCALHKVMRRSEDGSWSAQRIF